jgi:hypothetical protein
MTHSHDQGHIVEYNGQKLDRSPYLPLVHHGNTRAAWVGSIIAFVGFLVAGIAFVLPGGISWPIMWIGLGIVLLSAVVGGILRNLGHGAREDLLAPRGSER